MHQHEIEQQPGGASIAIDERMDGQEAVMSDDGAQQRIIGLARIIDPCDLFRHQVLDLACRWGCQEGATNADRD
jgi:hypothetical protein